jgi:hypothetical protein
LGEENRILRKQIKGRLRLSNAERRNLAEMGQRLGRKALEEVAQIVRPEAILAWHRKLVAKKFDGAKNRSTLGRPSTLKSLEDLVLQMSQDNRTWDYKRIAGALENLGHKISRESVANILKRHGVAPARNGARECFGRILSSRIWTCALMAAGGRGNRWIWNCSFPASR